GRGSVAIERRRRGSLDDGALSPPAVPQQSLHRENLMAGAKAPLTFRTFKGDQLIREERLSLSVIKLGKVPSAHLKLDDETVSRMHAIIEVNGPGDVSIIDLGSTKGTFVNGQKVNKAKLQSGDTIVVGETRIELAIGAGEEDEPTKVNTGAIG